MALASCMICEAIWRSFRKSCDRINGLESRNVQNIPLKKMEVAACSEIFQQKQKNNKQNSCLWLTRDKLTHPPKRSLKASSTIELFISSKIIFLHRSSDNTISYRVCLHSQFCSTRRKRMQDIQPPCGSWLTISTRQELFDLSFPIRELLLFARNMHITK